MVVLSVKELRKKFPFVRSELKKGSVFTIVYKNKPIAKLTPMEFSAQTEENEEQDFEELSAIDFDEGEDLSQEEIDYYLSLDEK